MSDTLNSSSPPLNHYYSDFAENYLDLGRSQLTVRNVKDAINFFMRHLSIKTIVQANDPRIISRAMSKVKEERGISPVTCNTYIKNLNTYFIWLERYDYLDKNRLRQVMRYTEPQKEQPTLSQEQVNALYFCINTRRQTKFQRLRNTFFIHLLTLTGARPCELAGLKVTDVIRSKKSYKLKLQGKKQKGRPRYYNFPSFIRDSFEAYMNYRIIIQRSEDPLFISCSKRRGWTEKGMRGLFKKLSRELGFKVGAYMIRRYVATKLYNDDMPIQKIADYLGHTRVSTTVRYIERSGYLTDDCVNQMESSLSSAFQSLSTSADLSNSSKSLSSLSYCAP